MKKMSVVKVLALFLGLNCLGPAWVNAAPPNADSHPQPFQQNLPSILGTWEGEGMLLARTYTDGVRNIAVNVKLTISAQPAAMTFPQLGPGPLFHGQMAVSFKDPDTANFGWGIVVFRPETSSYTCEVAGYISASGDITLTGTTSIQDLWLFPPGPNWPPEGYRGKTVFLKKEGTASLVSGKPRSIRGNFRVAVHGTDFWFGEPTADEPYLVSTAFAGTFNVHEALLR